MVEKLIRITISHSQRRRKQVKVGGGGTGFQGHLFIQEASGFCYKDVDIFADYASSTFFKNVKNYASLPKFTL
jgi:hypothetical protein